MHNEQYVPRDSRALQFAQLHTTVRQRRLIALIQLLTVDLLSDRGCDR